MDVDYNILEKIRQYYADELNTADTQQLDNLMNTDDSYAYHERLFRAMNEGIKDASTDKASYLEEVRQAAEKEPEQVLEAIKKSDRAGTRLRWWLFALPLIVIIGGLGYWLWPQAGDTEEALPTKPSSEQPIAEEATEEEDELFGTTGKAIQKEIPVLRFDEAEGQFVKTAERQALLLRKGRNAKNVYFYDGDTLVLLSQQYESLKVAKIELLQRDQNSFLRLADKVYSIQAGTEEPAALEEEVQME